MGIFVWPSAINLFRPEGPALSCYNLTSSQTHPLGNSSRETRGTESYADLRCPGVDGDSEDPFADFAPCQERNSEIPLVSVPALADNGFDFISVDRVLVFEN